MTKRIFLGIIISCFTMVAFSQIVPDTLPYLRFKTLPPFKITNVADSSFFTKDNLKKKKSTLIIVFSPGCEHCIHATKELLAHIDLFKKAQILMASPLEHDLLKKFYNDYKIGNYSNILMGRDPSFFLGTFYGLKSYPGIFVYNKKGKFLQSFDSDTAMEKIAAIL
jgi:thioredoxin-related protein